MLEFPSPEVFRRIVDQLDIGVYIVDRARKIQYWNRGAERITGFLAQDVVGRFCRDNILVHCDDHHPNLCGEDCPLTEAMHSGTAHSRQIYLRHHAGHRIPVEVHVVPLHAEDGTIRGAAEIFTENLAAPEFSNQSLVFAACGCLDEETGVPNHGLSESYLREQLDLLESHNIPFAAFVVRADSLHDFQTLHGREAGVAILSAVGRTLRHSLRATDFLGRWREDQFLVLLPYSERTPLEPAVERLRNVVSCTAIPWWGDLLSVKISVALIKAREGDTLESLKARIDGCFGGTPEAAGRTRCAEA
jgi:PAS domain S-box-containing protein/diguanylate cyclase (GGDEF)-like protein